MASINDEFSVYDELIDYEKFINYQMSNLNSEKFKEKENKLNIIQELIRLAKDNNLQKYDMKDPLKYWKHLRTYIASLDDEQLTVLLNTIHYSNVFTNIFYVCINIKHELKYLLGCLKYGEESAADNISRDMRDMITGYKIEYKENNKLYNILFGYKYPFYGNGGIIDEEFINDPENIFSKILHLACIEELKISYRVVEWLEKNANYCPEWIFDLRLSMSNKISDFNEWETILSEGDVPILLSHPLLPNPSDFLELDDTNHDKANNPWGFIGYRLYKNES